MQINFQKKRQKSLVVTSVSPKVSDVSKLIVPTKVSLNTDHEMLCNDNKCLCKAQVYKQAMMFQAYSAYCPEEAHMRVVRCFGGREVGTKDFFFLLEIRCWFTGGAKPF